MTTNQVSTERLNTVVTDNISFLWKFVRGLGVEASQADDIVQEALLVLTGKLERVEVGKERSFLIGCATRIARAQWRRGQRYTELTEEVPTLASPADAQLGEQARELLRQFVASLSEKHQAVFVLYEIQELSIPEVSTLLELPIGTVNSRLRKARSRYRSYVARLATESRYGYSNQRQEVGLGTTI